MKTEYKTLDEVFGIMKDQLSQPGKMVSADSCKNCNRQELMQRIHILNEANMELENAIASNADFFRQQMSVLEDECKEYERLKAAIPEVVSIIASMDLIRLDDDITFHEKKTKCINLLLGKEND